MAKYTGFKFEEEAYYPEAVSSGMYSAREYRTEYQRLYRVAQKRLRSFERAGREYTETYKYNVKRIKPSTQISDKDMGKAMYDIKRFLSSQRGSVSGQKAWEAERIKEFHEKGVTFVNKSNFRDFNDFMEECRRQHLDKIYGSEAVLELFGAAVGKGLDPEELFREFSFWVENRRKLASMKKIEGGTAADYLREIVKGSAE